MAQMGIAWIVTWGSSRPRPCFPRRTLFPPWAARGRSSSWFGGGGQGPYLRALFLFEQTSSHALEATDPALGLAASIELQADGKLFLHLSSREPLEFRLLFRSREFSSSERGDEGGFSSQATSFLTASSSQKNIRKFVFFGRELSDILVESTDSGEMQSKWFGIDSNYHLLAFVLPEKRSLRYRSLANGQLVIDFNQKSDSLQGYFIYAKKDYDNLKSLGDNLHLGVDFGFFSMVAVPLFKGLQFIHGVFPNWGVAIILLTLLIRLATFPLYYKQMKSMNKMKKIAPSLKKIKQKYQGDTRRQQVETMELFKREGVNPMGGCLPLILQMPIFFAFYKVLTVSAELDGRPFMGWITSLTEKDPYYVLPAVVTLLMWLNQKLMPQTVTDPMQQRIMNLMPLIFGLVFLSMPSGLNLYMLVSTAFGIAQQLFVNKRMEQAAA